LCREYNTTLLDFVFTDLNTYFSPHDTFRRTDPAQWPEDTHA
jgi:hypothetical protein